MPFKDPGGMNHFKNLLDTEVDRGIKEAKKYSNVKLFICHIYLTFIYTQTTLYACKLLTVSFSMKFMFHGL